MIEKVNKNAKKQKFVIKDKKKFIRCILIFVFILILIIIISIFGNKEIIINNTNISNININKYSKEVKLYYEGLMNDFIVEYNNVQNLAWIYIYNNISSDKNIEELIDEVNNIFLSDDWSSIGIEKNIKWRGSYKIDKEENAFTFKFESKNIEPAWIENNNVSYMIEKN